MPAALRRSWLLQRNFMHSLLVLTVLSSLSLTGEAPTRARLELGSSLTLPGSQRAERHLLDSRIHDTMGDESSTSRVFVEFLGGLAGEVIGAVPGALLLTSSSTLWAAGATVGFMIVANSAGVSIAGWSMDGRGRYGFALLGSLLGMVVPVVGGLVLLLGQGCNPDTHTNCGGLVPMVIGMLVLPSVGATIGYELSEPTPWLSLEASRAPTSAPRIAPVVTLARQGLGITFGLAGSL
jgi:hypothetical protein